MRASLCCGLAAVLGVVAGADAQVPEAAQSPPAAPVEPAAPAAAADERVELSAPQAEVLDSGADTPSVQVQVKGSCGLDEREVARILAIELSLAGDQVQQVEAPTVEIQCSPRWVRLTLYDRQTGGYLDRVVPAPDPADPGRERVVALAASQLVAAWLPGSRRTAGPVRAATPDASSVPEARASSAPDSELMLLGGARARDVAGRGIPMAAIGLRLGLGVTRAWSLGPAIELAHGQVERRAGSIDADLFSLGLGVGRVLLRSEAWRLDAGAALHGAYAKLEGEPAAGFREAQPSTDTLALDLELSIGPAWRHGPLSIGLTARVGAVLAEREARVANDDAVTLGGPWVGGDVAFRFRLGD